MKVELDKKTKALKYIPESHYDAYRLGRAVAKTGWGGLTYCLATGEITGVVFCTDGLLKRLEDDSNV